MKGGVIGLLLANTLYFCWQYFVASGDELDFLGESLVVEVFEEGVSKVVLISEAPEGSLRHFEDQVDSVALLAGNIGDSPDQASSTFCVEIGPFEEASQALLVVEAFAADVAMDMEPRPIAGPSNYRVYLPPYPNRDTATLALEALRLRLSASNLAIETFLVPRGELANAIALGLFSEQQNAINVQEQMRSLGYEVTVREEERSVPMYWLSSEQFDSKDIFDARWGEIRGSAPAVQVIEKLCQTIAQDTQFP